jgi:hypothetical protein
MKLHVAIDDRALVTSPRDRVPIRKLTARRDDSLTIDVTFSMNGRITSLPAGSTVTIAAYQGPGSRVALVSASNSSVIGRGTSTIYRFNAFSFALGALDSAFASQPVIPLVFELRVNSGSGGFTTAPVTLEVTQTANIGTINPPTPPAAPTYPIYIKEITALTGGGATALDGILTEGRQGLLVMCYVSGEMQTWRLFNGDSVENPSGGIVRPDDYKPSNQQVWKRLM